MLAMNVDNFDKVNDPPHLGFTQSSIQISSKRNDKLAFASRKLVNKLKNRTSTPILEKNIVMDISFSKCYQNVATQIDNDSGYISQNQESNSELVEGSSASAAVLSASKPVYLCEDALLERPDFKSQPEPNKSMDKEEKTLDSFERIEASVSSVSEHFSVLRDSIELNNSDSSQNSQTSVVISEIKPIIYKECNTNEICDTNDNSNIENNINLLNISNVTQNATKAFNESTESTKSFGTVRSCIEEPLSPELFSDEEILANRSIEEQQYQHVVCKEKYVLKQDEKLIKNVQSTLSGVLPPPSLTVIQLSVEEILEKIEANKHIFWTEDAMVNHKNSMESQKDKNVLNLSNEVQGSLLLTTTDKECVKAEFPEVMEHRYHGLHYNRSRLSEDFESLCMKYAERYIGCETQSTCVVFQQPSLSSPMKRKANKLRWAVKSPGRRLSHLAKRRITFSSASLQASSAASTSNSQTRQVVMDSRRFQLLSRKKSPFKKSPRKTPKKSPRRSPRKKIRTPSSSAKKRLSLQLQSISKNGILNEIATATRATTTKRALFQSPDKLGTSLSKPLFPSTSGTSSLSPFKKRTTPKCVLFTSPSKSSLAQPRNDNKRKRTDSEDIQVTKLSRSVSLQENVASNSSVKRGLSRVKSDLTLTATQSTGELSAHHRKKLQWAVYEALRSQNIGINHPQFKQFASVLARVTKRFLPNLSANVPRPEGGTSDRMLRIARQNIYAVTKGKTVDEILHDYEQNRLKNLKPNGYIGLDGVPSSGDVSIARNRENVFKDRLNTMSSEKQNLGLNREELIKTTLPKFENRVDRARRMINFDNENSSDIR